MFSRVGLSWPASRLSLICRANLNMISVWNYAFSCQKAIVLLNYSPKYTSEQAHKQSLTWWTQKFSEKEEWLEIEIESLKKIKFKCVKIVIENWNWNLCPTTYPNTRLSRLTDNRWLDGHWKFSEKKGMIWNGMRDYACYCFFLFTAAFALCTQRQTQL